MSYVLMRKVQLIDDASIKRYFTQLNNFVQKQICAQIYGNTSFYQEKDTKRKNIKQDYN